LTVPTAMVFLPICSVPADRAYFERRSCDDEATPSRHQVRAL
jgi:hypothetical protein